MDKQTISPEERLKQINEERKSLKETIKSDRDIRLEEDAKMRVERDEKIDLIREKLIKVSKAIYLYNKLGKVAKMKCDILGIISNHLNEVNLED